MNERAQARKAAPPPTPARPAAEPIPRRELVLLAAILLVGAALRLAALSRSAVEHFDEGVYASNVYFAAPDLAYPQQRFYAPPLLPALIEAGMLAGLPPNVAALLPGFLAGCGTIAALWWFGRSWFGPGVGLAAATLAALSDFHIAYSAAALTDVLLGLWLVLAVDAIARSLARDDFRWAIGAGLYTGLAWWTKYNGWLPLAIEAAALPLIWLLTQGRFLPRLWCFAATAATAAVVWAPYYLSLQSQGGYGPIAANHAKYVVGLSGWPGAIGRQISAQYLLQMAPSALSLGVALIVMRWAVPQHGRSWLGILWRSASALLASLIFTLMFTSVVIAGVAAAIGIGVSLVTLFRQPKLAPADGARAIALSLVAAWWLGMLVATPCYWPYPRLVLPWLLAAWLGTALCWQQAARSDETWQPPRWLGPIIFLAFMAATCLISAQLPKSWEQLPSSNRRDLQTIAAQIHSQLATEADRAFYVVGEPAIFFQLAATGESIVAPVQDVPIEPAKLNDRALRTYLVTGPHAHRDPQFQQQWAAAKDHWQLVQSHDYQPSPLVWLDLHDPRQPVSPDAAELNRIELYRLK